MNDDRRETRTFQVRLATTDDLPWMLSLERRHYREIGFIPSAELERRIPRGLVIMCLDNDDPTGFIVWKPELHWAPGLSAVHQILIREDARRQERASALLLSVVVAAEKLDQRGIGCMCAADLESTAFWEAMGWPLIGTVHGGKLRGRTLNVYRKLWRPWDGWEAPLRDPARTAGGLLTRRPERPDLNQLRLWPAEPKLRTH